MTTNIMTLGSNVNIVVYGEHTNGNCIPTLCIEKRIAFTSQSDAAQYFGVHPTQISYACRTGNKCKGYHFVRLDDTAKAMEIIMAQAQKERDAEAREKEKEKRKQEREARRDARAREKHEKAIASTKKHIAREREKNKKMYDEIMQRADNIKALEAELAALEAMSI